MSQRFRIQRPDSRLQALPVLLACILLELRQIRIRYWGLFLVLF
jgi:hypothetical protein